MDCKGVISIRVCLDDHARLLMVFWNVFEGASGAGNVSQRFCLFGKSNKILKSFVKAGFKTMIA